MVYDPENEIWTATGGMSTERYTHAVTLLLDGRVLTIGGAWFDEIEAIFSQDTTEAYDPERGAWSLTGRMYHGRCTPVVTLLTDGRVLVVGGYAYYNPSTQFLGRFDSLSSAELFTP